MYIARRHLVPYMGTYKALLLVGLLYLTFKMSHFCYLHYIIWNNTVFTLLYIAEQKAEPKSFLKIGFAAVSLVLTFLEAEQKNLFIYCFVSSSSLLFISFSPITMHFVTIVTQHLNNFKFRQKHNQLKDSRLRTSGSQSWVQTCYEFSLGRMTISSDLKHIERFFLM